MMIPKMVCSWHYSCLVLPAALVGCQVEGCSLHLHHVFQWGYVLLYGIDFEGGEWKICRDCVDNIGWGSSQINQRRWDTTLCTGRFN